MKVKIFGGKGNTLEEIINLWLEQNPGISIHKVMQSECCDAKGLGWSVTITFLYWEPEN